MADVPNGKNGSSEGLQEKLDAALAAAMPNGTLDEIRSTLISSEIPNADQEEIEGGAGRYTAQTMPPEAIEEIKRMVEESQPEKEGLSKKASDFLERVSGKIRKIKIPKLPEITSKIKRWWPAIITGILLLLAVSLLVITLGLPLTLVLILISSITLFSVVYFYLAPRDIFFTFVNEGDAVPVEKGNQFAYMLMGCKGFTFRNKAEGTQEREEDNWDVVRGHEWHLFGGLRFFGLSPLYKIPSACNRWRHYHAEERKLVYHEEEQSFVRLKKDSYGTEFTMKDPAEDIDGVAVEAILVFAAWIYNPFIVRYRQQAWFNLVEPVMARVLKEFIARYRWRDDLTTMTAGKDIEQKHKDKGIVSQIVMGKSLKDELWDALRAAVLQSLDEKNIKYVIRPSRQFGEEIRFYGIAIQKLGTNIVDVDPGDKYRAAGTRKYDAETAKEAALVAADMRLEVAEIDAKAEAIRGMDTFLGMLKKAGVPDDKVKEVAVPFAEAQVPRQLAQQDHKYLHINVEGAGCEGSGLVGGFAAVIAAAQEIMRRSDTAQPPSTSKTPGGAKEKPSQRNEDGKKGRDGPGRKLIFKTDQGTQLFSVPGGSEIVYRDGEVVKIPSARRRRGSKEDGLEEEKDFEEGFE